MAEATPTKRVLPPRERRASAIKRRASSPGSLIHDKNTSTSSARTTTTPSTDSKPKRRYDKRIKTTHLSTPSRETSIPTSNAEELLPTKILNTRPLPCRSEKQPASLSTTQYQSIADSAILSASLHRSRMQWLCDGIFKKYWVKPVKRKKMVEEPPNNPDIKTMQKLGTATITIEPHSFEATFYIVREAVPMTIPAVKPLSTPQATPMKPAGTPTMHTQANKTPAATGSTTTPTQPVQGSSTTKLPSPKTTSSTPTQPRPLPQPNTMSSAKPPTQSSLNQSNAAQTPIRTANPPAAKTTDPVIQMLAQRAAVDPQLKELMKIVAASEATSEQLREFQKHIDGFNAIVRKQESEREARAKLAAATGSPHPFPSHYGIARGSPLNPHFTPHPVQARPEPPIKHIIIEFTSPPGRGEPVVADRWLFPEYAVLDTQFGGSEMTCSFLVEMKGSEILAKMSDASLEDVQSMVQPWKADTEYYQPVTMVITASQPRTLETIARSARSLTQVQEKMQQLMATKTRAPQMYLVHQLAKVAHNVDFTDSGVDLDDDDILEDSYPV